MRTWFTHLTANMVHRGTILRMASTAGIASLLTLLVVVGVRAADPAPTVYYACVNTASGTIHMTNSTASCQTNETKVAWNQVGPQGPAGPTGAQGPTGPAGHGFVSNNLSGAKLFELAWPYLDLTGLDLSHAFMRDANLAGANLSGDNLTGADLTNANLTGAIFTGATVTGVTWSQTTCRDGTNSDSDGGTCVANQVVTNHVTNALKYAQRDRPVDVSLTAREPGAGDGVPSGCAGGQAHSLSGRGGTVTLTTTRTRRRPEEQDLPLG